MGIKLKLTRKIFFIPLSKARVVELVDTPDLGSGAARCEGSSPSLGTIYRSYGDELITD